MRRVCGQIRSTVTSAHDAEVLDLAGHRLGVDPGQRRTELHVGGQHHELGRGSLRPRRPRSSARRTRPDQPRTQAATPKTATTSASRTRRRATAGGARPSAVPRTAPVSGPPTGDARLRDVFVVLMRSLARHALDEQRRRTSGPSIVTSPAPRVMTTSPDRARATSSGATADHDGSKRTLLSGQRYRGGDQRPGHAGLGILAGA